MLKKLDILVIKAFIGPFIATFFITVLVLLMQFFWLWVDDFVGKGISTSVLFEFIWYQSAVLVPLALPLAILLSSIMTFGNLGESYELVAIKSAGISLLRFMQPLLFVTLLHLLHQKTYYYREASFRTCPVAPTRVPVNIGSQFSQKV